MSHAKFCQWVTRRGAHATTDACPYVCCLSVQARHVKRHTRWGGMRTLCGAWYVSSGSMSYGVRCVLVSSFQHYVVRPHDKRRHISFAAAPTLHLRTLASRRARSGVSIRSAHSSCHFASCDAAKWDETVIRVRACVPVAGLISKKEAYSIKLPLYIKAVFKARLCRKACCPCSR